MGPFKCYKNNAGGDGGVRFSGKKHYEGVRFNVISVTRGWVGVQFPDKKPYVTLEWPLHDFCIAKCSYYKLCVCYTGHQSSRQPTKLFHLLAFYSCMIVMT